jgi:uncharacterized protein (DUF2141 family)
MKNKHFKHIMMIRNKPGGNSFQAGLLFQSGLILFSCLLLWQCARQGTPTGGPKDSTPPEIVGEIPENRSVNFRESKVFITFNEFIQLKDASKEIFISPPMKTKPEYKAQGKKIVVEFKEDLKANSTYTINFGSAIVDFTENNPLVNYEYVFSTGNHIDSLSVSGKILQALDHKPAEGIVVMVYTDNNDTILLDSLPLRLPPESASRTTKEGVFHINNLSPGEYKLFALEDLNSNFIFDLPNEQVAFLDSLIRLSPPETDSLPPMIMDSSYQAANIDGTDTINLQAPSMNIMPENNYTIYLFKEADTSRKLLSRKLIGDHMLQYIYSTPIDSVKISPLDFQTGIPDWYLLEYGKMRDTLNIWLRTGLPDTIRVIVNAGDSLVDTARYVIHREAGDKAGKRKGTDAGRLGIFPSTLAGAFDLDRKFNLYFSRPIEDKDSTLLRLYTPADTIIPVFFFPDTLKRQGVIDYPWSPGEFYQLLIPDSTFCDISGAYNDSIDFMFKVRIPEDYGILIMNITLPELSGQYIIQLLNDKENLIREEVMMHSGQARFGYLMPGNYKLKIIYDSNSNNKWDTGNYRKGKLPERIEYYSTGIVIRANWELQEDWVLE